MRIVFLLAFMLCQINTAAQEVDGVRLKELVQGRVEALLKEDVFELEGERLPLYELRLINGGTLYTDSFEGKPTVLNIWFTSCPPCIEEISILNDLKLRFGSSVNFVSITFETRPDVALFLESVPFNFMHVIDAESYINRLGIKHYPKTIIVDQDLVVQSVLGVAKDLEVHDSELKTSLNKLLERK